MADENWYDPDITTFGDRLAGARETAGLSQADLARRLGVKVKTLRAWEVDQSEPRANRVQMLSGLLNVSLVWLMTGEGEGPALPGEPAESGDGELLRELVRAQRESERLTDRLRVLESRVRARLSEPV
ncbi:MAG: helix-turn-helix transcriptional regulator [Pseudomonadota bacterium]